MTKDKHPLILWSGGYDSTALVMSAISYGVKFDLLNVTLNNNSLKGIKESQARKNILRILKPGKLLRNEYNYTYNSFMHVTSRMIQPLFWIHTAILHIQEHHTEVQLGYIKGCCPLNGSTSLHDAYDAFFELGSFHFDKPELVLPFKISNKEDILRSWYYNDDFPIGQEVRQYIWTCEGLKKIGRKIEKCGKCHACLTEAKTKFLIENFKEDK